MIEFSYPNLVITVHGKCQTINYLHGKGDLLGESKGPPG